MKHYVYYNLHRKLFSCKDTKTGLVDKGMYTNSLMIEDCDFKVSEKGRQRVLKEKRKNVHAGIVGEVVSYNIGDVTSKDLKGYFELTYNPYRYDSFVIKETGEPVKWAYQVILFNKRIFAKGIQTRLY